MKAKDEIIHNMDIVELYRARVMEERANKRLHRAFIVVQKVCDFKTTMEPFGFEGESVNKCNNDKHQHVGAMYTTCSAKLCPHGRD